VLWKPIGRWVWCGVTTALVSSVGEDWMLEEPLRFFWVNEAGVTLPSVVYFTVAEVTGGTLGQRLMGIEVRSREGTKLEPSMALVRSWLEMTPMELSHLGHAFTFTDKPDPERALVFYSAGAAGLALKLAAPFFNSGEYGWVDWLGTKVVRRDEHLARDP